MDVALVAVIGLFGIYEVSKNKETFVNNKMHNDNNTKQIHNDRLTINSTC